MTLLHRWVRTSLVVVLVTTGCDPDDPGSDSGTLGMDSGTTSGACEGGSDGASCGDAMICLSGACVASACGDGFLDAARGEQCDDGNPNAFDGCEPGTCTYTCTANDECDDGESCNGAETCGDTTHVCVEGTPLGAGAPCARAGAANGVCRGEGLNAECADPGCGNGVVDGTEECEDENTINGDGCDNDCTFSCTTNEECAAIDMDMCDGEDVCDTTTHTCQPGTALNCDDGIDCTDDSCVPATGCAHEDNGTGAFWYADCDNDGYAFSESGAERKCIGMPVGAPVICGGGGAWVSRRPIGADVDCLDTNRDVHPGITAFFTTPIAGEPAATDFDYNCSESEELERVGQSSATCRCTGDWYYDDRMGLPACGERQTYKWACTSSSGSCTGYWARTAAADIVACH